MTVVPGSRRASISDVAKRAHVAVGTVSNVLNRPEVVAPATRERVRAAIDDLSFVPNGTARRLRVGTITTVGALLLDIANPFFTEVARGIEDRLALDDHTLMLASTDDDPERESRYVRLFEEHGVVGLLVVATTPDVTHLLAAMARGMRVVLMDSASPTPAIASVSVDDEAGGAMAAGHLLSLGHDRLTFLNGPHAVRQCRDRSAGVRRAVAAAGLDPDIALREVELPTLNAAGGDAAIRHLLDGVDGAPPSAVMCVNDLVAIGVQRALRHTGGADFLHRIALVGYDDIDVASELATPLTSVRRPKHELGYRAADLLLAGGDAGVVPEQVVFQPELVVRESSLAAG
ncbi:LacI family DNA-binding transcriptional regulator [Pengzhenrongella sicca]|uniref:LacI family DNA-binding transcriptional regulator n=1 Tax=Pengzhenrongella sicca TaxID=2819238 RepID=A0A8A4ZFP7_9MICO|nr:LacI family DNA-binding transcriptional regulator [Pengzhenrongella sicca]QTE30115.1 LacI family DNA-binding transcriptional regulator [Pengzhenrongella sicca]